jgi:hypothetical protein
LRVALDQFTAGEKGLGASIIARLEMYLCQPKCILVVLYA